MCLLCLTRMNTNECFEADCGQADRRLFSKVVVVIPNCAWSSWDEFFDRFCLNLIWFDCWINLELHENMTFNKLPQLREMFATWQIVNESAMQNSASCVGAITSKQEDNQCDEKIDEIWFQCSCYRFWRIVPCSTIVEITKKIWAYHSARIHTNNTHVVVFIIFVCPSIV